MEELLELRGYLEQQRYTEALTLVTEMEEISWDDKINKIGSFSRILLIHLIKRHAEKRTTRSWDTSIFNALFEIARTNTRHKSKGFYLNVQEMRDILEAYYPSALRYAALEACEGQYDARELEQFFDLPVMLDEALNLIIEHNGVEKPAIAPDSGK